MIVQIFTNRRGEHGYEEDGLYVELRLLRAALLFVPAAEFVSEGPEPSAGSFSFFTGLGFPPANRWSDDLVFSAPVFHDDFHRSIQQLHQMVEELKLRTRPAHAA